MGSWYFEDPGSSTFYAGAEAASDEALKKAADYLSRLSAGGFHGMRGRIKAINREIEKRRINE